ncbi:odorant receptor 2a-like [Teleopsis dalmanni]|uniref:odorant receptor 2a-like n=1 Tax=Teleopsis dalmanni TaxID=139649 RepID=UPI0018CD3B1E|nr:odorant receptor 2a-like [Teleopsis dalmanni]
MTSEIKTWEALTYQWKVWKFFGLVPPQEGSIWLNCMQSKSVSEFCENGYMAVTVIVSNLKFLNSYFSLHNLLKVRPILKELDKRAKSQAEDQILLKGKNNARKCFMFYVRIFSVTHFTSNLIVFLAKERRLIYPAWFPWNWKDSFTYYAICYVYQLYAITAYAVIEAINVTYPSMHMCILSAHIEALATRIKNLGSKEAIYDNNSKKQEEKLYKELTECVKVHEIITKILDIIPTSNVKAQTFISNMMTEVNTWEALTYQWKVWKIFGLVPPQQGSPWRLVYIVGTTAFNISVYLLFPITLIVNCFHSKNVAEFCENFYLTITVILCTLKFLNVAFSRKNLLKVRSILEELDKRANTEAEREILLKGKNDGKKCFMFYARIFGMTFLTSNLIVYLAKERRFMYPAWFPWNWRDSRKYFAISYLYQLQALAGQAISEFVNVTYPSIHLRLISAHIAALAIRIENLGLKETNTNAADFNERDENLYKQLTECTKDHDIIRNLFRITERTIAATCIFQFMSTGFAQCTLAIFFLYNGLSSDIKLINNFFFFLGVTFETFDLCYYGSQLQEEYRNLNKAIYSCNWMDQNKRFKHALLILLHRSQTFTNINAYIVPITLPTFLKVMRTTYTGFTFLFNIK